MNHGDEKPSGKYAPRLQWTPIDENIAAVIKERTLDLARGGKTRETALDLALNAMVWADHLLDRFEAESPTPQPLACKKGCDFCCFNQIELTPPEALLLGHYVAQNFSPQERSLLLKRVARSLNLRSGKSKSEIARMRQELPCPLLRAGSCRVYPVRPLLCRAMHALDAGECERELKSQGLALGAYYSHRYDLVLSIAAGLMDGCRALGCQSGALDLAWALEDYFQAERPGERWIQGEAVFRPVAPEPRS